MIPKIIHYCWLSDEPIPREYSDYIEGWSRIMPDYQIKKWDKKAFDIHSALWVEQAYAHRKWAFAADYIRAYALYTEGGFYLDSDVKVLKRFDNLLNYGFVSSIESNPKVWGRVQEQIDAMGQRLPQYNYVSGFGIQAAIIASEKGHCFPKMLLDYYNTHEFYNGEKYDLLPAPIIYAKLLEGYGLKYYDKEQILEKRIVLLRSNVLSDYQSCVFGSAAIHMCAGSWVQSPMAIRTKIIKRFLWVRKFKNWILYNKKCMIATKEDP